MAQLILLILFPLVGFLCGKFNITKSEDYRILADLAFYIFLPCSVLVSFIDFEINQQLLQTFVVLLASLAIFSLILFIIVKSFKFKYDQATAVLMCGIFGNIIFLGLPLGETIFGPAIAPIFNIFIAIHNLFIFGIVFPIIIYFGQNGKTTIKSSLKRVLKNTVVIFAVIGILIKVSGMDATFAVPYLKQFSSLTTPISMLAMGIYFSKNVKIDISKDLILITALKVLAFPAITFVLFYNNPYLKEAVFMSIMPVAISNFSIIGSISKKHEKLVMDSIFGSTLISLILVGILKITGFF